MERILGVGVGGVWSEYEAMDADLQPPDDLDAYVARIRACRRCAGDMPNRPNPILRASTTARILIASQAPGNLADRSGKPFDDPSGVRLRAWMAVSEDEFYDDTRIAIALMGFCFPGYDKKGGDLPPMKRCAARNGGGGFWSGCRRSSSSC